MTFVVSLFVTSRKVLFGCFFVKENYYCFTKNSRKFRQASLKGVLLVFWNASAKSFKCTCEKVESFKNLYYTWTYSQVIFKVSGWIIFTYLLIHLFYEACLSYVTHILYLHSYLWKVLLSASTLPENFVLDLINLFNNISLSNKYF